MSDIFGNNAQGKQGKALSLSDLPFNIFNGKHIDQTSWSWLNLIGQKPSVASAEQQGVDYAQPRHNYFANGHFLIDQVNEGAAYTVNTTNVACMDGVRASVVGAGVFTVERATHPDNAALKTCKISCTTADASIAAGDYATIEFRIPGNECLDLKLGTTEAESLTIQFEFKTTTTGYYGVSIENSAANRVYATTFNATSTSTQTHTITIPMDTTGTWLYTSGIGFTVRIALTAGSTYQGTLNTWSSSDIWTSSAQANFLSSTSNVCYISELQMVKGTVAGEMPVADYNADLARCQRHLEKSFAQGTIPAQNVGVVNGEWRFSQCVGASTSQAGLTIPYKVTKSGAFVAITLYNPSATNGEVRNTAVSADCASTSLSDTSDKKAIHINTVTPAGSAAGNTLSIHYLADYRL